MRLSARAELEDLLVSLFSNGELRRFLVRYDPSIEADLPGPDTATTELAHQAVGMLQKRGRVGEELFEALRHERPRRWDVDAVCRRWSEDGRCEEVPLVQASLAELVDEVLLRIGGAVSARLRRRVTRVLRGGGGPLRFEPDDRNTIPSDARERLVQIAVLDGLLSDRDLHLPVDVVREVIPRVFVLASLDLAGRRVRVRPGLSRVPSELGLDPAMRVLLPDQELAAFLAGVIGAGDGEGWMRVG